jgi:hypothetical protein
MLATDSVYFILFGAYFEVAFIAHQRTSREQDARRNFGVNVSRRRLRCTSASSHSPAKSHGEACVGKCAAFSTLRFSTKRCAD